MSTAIYTDNSIDDCLYHGPNKAIAECCADLKSVHSYLYLPVGIKVHTMTLTVHPNMTAE